MGFSKKKVEDMYQSGAKHYDLFVWCYRLIGFRIDEYRSRAVELLRLKRGRLCCRAWVRDRVKFSTYQR